MDDTAAPATGPAAAAAAGAASPSVAREPTTMPAPPQGWGTWLRQVWQQARVRLTGATLLTEPVAENAARLCNANDAQIYRVDGDFLVPSASYGPIPPYERRPISRGWVTGRAVADRRTVHVADPDGFVVEFAQEIPRARSRRSG